MTAPRVLIAIWPLMHAETLAFSLGKHRPRADVSLLGPSEDLEAEALGAEISADGYSRRVADVRTEHVLEALDRVEEEPVLGPDHAQGGGGS